jgi:DNA-binding transcriptional LysR family regulator
MIPRPPFDALAAFVSVADLGGFTAAAKELGVAKATLSRLVARLEADCGVVLLARTTRKLALTEAGERVLAHGRQMLAEADAAIEAATESREAPRGRLRVAVPLSWSLRYLSPVLPLFLARWPDVRLELSLEDRAVDLITEGYDAAIRIRRMEDSSLTARKLAPVGHRIVASPAYVAKFGAPERPEDLSRHACLIYSNLASGAVWRFTGPDGQAVEVRVDGRASSNNFDVFEPLLLAGEGIALAPDFICWQGIKDGSLVALLPDWSMPMLDLHLLTPPGRSMPRRLRVFSDFLYEQFGGGRAPWLASGVRPSAAPGP